jgi:hypothetical protein
MRMADVTFDPQPDSDGTDRSALVMMLTYVEAECRRMGDEAAARHAALAAAMVMGRSPEVGTLRPSRRRGSATAAVN